MLNDLDDLMECARRDLPTFLRVLLCCQWYCARLPIVTIFLERDRTYTVYVDLKFKRVRDTSLSLENNGNLCFTCKANPDWLPKYAILQPRETSNIRRLSLIIWNIRNDYHERTFDKGFTSQIQHEIFYCSILLHVQKIFISWYSLCSSPGSS